MADLTPCNHQDRDEGDNPVERCWETFWKEIIEKNGKVDLEQIKKELHDYHGIMENAAIVYDRVTGGRISKPNTHASEVIGEAESEFQRQWDEAEEERDENSTPTITPAQIEAVNKAMLALDSLPQSMGYSRIESAALRTAFAGQLGEEK